MNRFGRIVAAAVSAVTVSLWAAQSALALAPLNDTIDGATPAFDGFVEVLDTSEATTDADDFQLNETCGAPATDASVWYTFTTSTASAVVVDVSQSNFSAGVLVGVGTPGELFTISCGPGTVVFFAAPGETYYVLAIDAQEDGGGNGGLLSISFTALEAPVVDIAVDRFGSVNPRTGIATISGTYSCTNGFFLDVFVSARQAVGRIATISGDGFFTDFDTCDGTPRPWAVDLIPYSGKFAGGKALTVTFAVSCGNFTCSEGFVEQTIQLRGNGR